MSDSGSRVSIALSRGDFQGALIEYASSFRHFSKYSDLAGISSCLYHLGRFRLAARVAKRVVTSDLSLAPQANLVIANCEVELKRYREAWVLYRSLIHTRVAPQALTGIAEICGRLGRNGTKKRIINRMVTNYPNDIDANLLASIYYINKGEFSTAWKRIQRTLELNSDHIPAWRAALRCSISLGLPDVTHAIAEKLVFLDPEYHLYREWLGLSLHNLDMPSECSAAFIMAHKLKPSCLTYFLNSFIECHRIPMHGRMAHKTASRMLSAAEHITNSIKLGKRWTVDLSRTLIPYAFYVAYSPLNVRRVYQPYFKAITPIFSDIIDRAHSESRAMLERWRSCIAKQEYTPRETSSPEPKIRIGFISQFFYLHSNSQAFSGYIKYLNRDDFEVILIHKHGVVDDPVHRYVNSLADEVVYLNNSLADSAFLIGSLDLNILFFTDIGMDSLDFLFPELRLCPLQITGWGIPHTSGLRSLDYYISSSWMESEAHQNEYTEKLVLLDGLPCCFLSEMLFYRKLDREYFMLPQGHTIIGCVQVIRKIHPDMDLIIEQIAKRLPDVIFAFMCDFDERISSLFLERLSARAPTAYPRVILLNRCENNEFLSLCDCIDILLDTPYYGAGITAYLSMYVGTPTACFSGSRLRDSTTAKIYSFLQIQDAPISHSISHYIDNVVHFASDPKLRHQVKSETAASAKLLYDDKTVIQDFERFCKTCLVQYNNEKEL